MDDKPINFGQFWYADFIGIAYAFENGNLVICPYFDDKEKAKHVYSKIEGWNPKFVRVRFMEYGSDSYAFIAYQNPKTSYDKVNFGLYRSSMDRHGHYSKARERLLSDKLKLAIAYTKTPNEPGTFQPIGDDLDIGDCKVISEAELESIDYQIEKWADETCRANKD